ncbi:hypothetical protein QYE76_013569 [Lolium multiflorum]|uniref:Transposase-associated domain-containing protein n=1 Tax=Lolium multiflorum TaxID=4521 RepID=A0AAD8X7C7_LOLMU|nr:hypothetical protein QYE76_013569 [Lolium multiflorum]
MVLFGRGGGRSREFLHAGSLVGVLHGQMVAAPAFGVCDDFYRLPSAGHVQPPGYYAIAEALWLRAALRLTAPSGSVPGKAHEGHDLDVYCPRCTCMNGEKRPHHVVEDHLHIFGMDRTYVRWVYHGEPHNDPSAGEADLAHTMDGREGEKKRLLQETGFSSGTCAVPDEKLVQERKYLGGGGGAMERKATTHVGSWLSLSCVPSPTKQVGTSRFHAEAMGNENSAPPAAGAWPDLQHKKRNATAELGRDRPGTETLGPLLKRKIKTAADQAASMLMSPPSSKCLYKHKATRQLGGDLLMNMDEASVPLLKWIKNDPDEAAVKMMVPPPSSENLLKHKATGQLGGILFKQTETAKPSLVKRIATAADEASAEAATKLLSAPPSGCLYKLKSKDQPDKLPKSIAKDLNAGRRGKISLVMESEGLTVEGRYSVSPTDGRLAVTSRWKNFIDGAKLRIGSKLKVKIFRCRCDMLVIKFAVV